MGQYNGKRHSSELILLQGFMLMHADTGWCFVYLFWLQAVWLPLSMQEKNYLEKHISEMFYGRPT